MITMKRHDTKIRSVLLVGEASGVHRNLAKGLRACGVEVKHMVQSDATSWKWYDDSFSHSRSGWQGGVSRNLEPFWSIAKLKDYDVINFTNTITSVHGIYTRHLDIPFIKKKSRILTYYALGCDEIGIVRRNSALPYSACEGCINSSDSLGQDCQKHLNPKWESNIKKVEQYFEYGASSTIEYEHTAAAFKANLFDRIMFPVDIESISFSPAHEKEKPVIVHTPTRRGFKGTKFVIEALNKLGNKRKDFDFQIIEGLAYDEYLKRMSQTDIVIDQVFSQSPGINALEMMASGKIVFTGATDLGRSFTDAMLALPAFDASPDPETLARSLDAVLDRKAEFGRIALEGRAYVQRHHDPVEIARQFLSGWERAIAAKISSHEAA